MRRDTEADARIAIDDLLRAANWDPRDKSQVGTEIPATAATTTTRLASRAEARPFDSHAPVYDLAAAAGTFSPDHGVGTSTDEIGWMAVPGQHRLTQPLRGTRAPRMNCGSAPAPSRGPPPPRLRPSDH